MSLLFSLIASAFYAFAGWRALRAQYDRERLVLTLALLAHGLALSQQVVSGGNLVIGIAESLSMLAFLSSLMLWIFCFREPLHAIGAVHYPVTALWVLAPAVFTDHGHPIPLADWRIGLHIVFSLLSAGLLTLASIQAVATLSLDRMLRKPGNMMLVRRLPPLQTMERLLFQLIFFGFFLLSMTLVSGLLFVHNLFAQHLVHKTVLSFFAWLIFGLLLWGRVRHGWRGRTAVRWALSGYVALVLAYFGSKLILEQVLGRSWY
ncbi:cytochrome c biogenesis protein CcsA [Nevskia sp.]|uniref:cytochrome C assembly family protein n=1 Tax=Nevskia sp. TaxID=1929292 RepID=UPI0025DC99D7|nr:cytochrome c biogenesis protein CcsA [Nevskia sp.]